MFNAVCERCASPLLACSSAFSSSRRLLQPNAGTAQQQRFHNPASCKINDRTTCYIIVVAAPATPAVASAGPHVLKKPAVALDVEYAHYLTAEGRQISVPAWVALVDQDCSVLIKTHIQQQVKGSARWKGGVSLSDCAAAPPLSAVLPQLQVLISQQLLVGHGLSKDMTALGLDHPVDLRFDTITYTAFCNKAGSAYTLKQLAKQFLSQHIQSKPAARGRQQQGRRSKSGRGKQHGSTTPQQGSASTAAAPLQPQGWDQQQHGLQATSTQHLALTGQQAQTNQVNACAALKPQQQHGQRQDALNSWPSGGSGHDPEEDAAAAMQLYQQVVFPSTYEGQVAAATAQVLTAMKARSNSTEGA